MKPADKAFLDGLRKSVCEDIAQDHWDLVVKAVDDAGDIRDVAGYARTIILQGVEKARFASRSEAGRYAANMRWKGQGQATGPKKGDSAQKLPKEYQRVLDRADKTKQGYLKTLDELDSMKRERKEEIKLSMDSGTSRAEATAGVDEYIATLEQAISGSKFNDDNSAPSGEGVDSPKITTSRGVSLKDADLSEISATIRRDIKSQGKKVNEAAKPYLDALDTMGDIKDKYYEDSGTSVVAYLLGNLSTYKGETARAIKAELNARLKAERKN